MTQFEIEMLAHMAALNETLKDISSNIYAVGESLNEIDASLEAITYAIKQLED